jgi:hypothetical protein
MVALFTSLRAQCPFVDCLTTVRAPVLITSLASVVFGFLTLKSSEGWSLPCAPPTSPVNGDGTGWNASYTNASHTEAALTAAWAPSVI